MEVDGPIRVNALLDRLELSPESVLVIREDTLVPRDALLEDHDHIEIRPVISGGDGPLRSGAEQHRGPSASAAPELPSAARPLEGDGPLRSGAEQHRGPSASAAPELPSAARPLEGDGSP